MLLIFEIAGSGRYERWNVVSPWSEDRGTATLLEDM